MEEFAQIERELQEQSTQLSSREEYLVWEKQCDECLELLKEQSRSKRLRLSIGVQQSLVSRIARLEGLKNSVQERFVCTGAGHSSRDVRFIWREIDTAFKKRVLTGTVINLNHIELRQFLEDVKETVIEHVRNAIEKNDCVKVNTIFNGEFVAGNKRANKSINTRNCELFNASDLKKMV